MKFRKLPANTLKMLEFLSVPGAKVLIVGDNSYALNKKDHRYLSDPLFECLSSRGWVTPMLALGEGVGMCEISSQGKLVVEKAEAARRQFNQLSLFEEEEKLLENVVFQMELSIG
jgi:hypothetical protein